MEGRSVMHDNLPGNRRDVEDTYVIGKDERGYELIHYVLAERLMQVEYAQIMSERDPCSDTLIYILEGGFRGYHKFTADQLKAEWLDGANDKWFQLYEDGELPWEIFEDDPLAEEAA